MTSAALIAFSLHGAAGVVYRRETLAVDAPAGIAPGYPHAGAPMPSADSSLLRRSSLPDATGTDSCGLKSIFVNVTHPPTWGELWDIDDFLTCLNTVPISAERRDSTLQTITEQIQDAYAFNPWIKDSKASNTAITGCSHKFEEHESRLGPWMKKELEHGGKLWGASSFGELWVPLSKFGVMLRDAHTNVMAPWHGLVFALSPFAFVKDRVGDGWHITDWTGIREEGRITTKFVDPAAKEHLGKSLASINGLPPTTYMRTLAETNLGGIRSAGGRLNSFLRGGQFLDDYFVPPDGGALSLNFTDGSRYSGAWKMFVHSGTPPPAGMTNAELLSKVWSKNALFDILNGAYKFVDVPSTNDDMDRGAIRYAAGADNSTLQSDGEKLNRKMEMDIQQRKKKALPPEQTTPKAEVSESPAPPPAAVTEQGGAAGATVETHSALISKVAFTQLSPPPSSSGGSEGETWSVTKYFPTTPDAKYGEECSVSVATGGATGKTIVTWKLNGYMFPASQPETAVEMSELAVKLAAELGGGELIIDLLGNGGGSVMASAWEAMYFFGALSKQMQPLSTVCPVIDEKLSHLTRGLIADTAALNKIKTAAQANAVDIAFALPNATATARLLESYRTLLGESLVELHGVTIEEVNLMAPVDFYAWCESVGLTAESGNMLMSMVKFGIAASRVATCIPMLQKTVHNTGSLQDQCGIIEFLEETANFREATQAVRGGTALMPAIFYNGLPWPNTDVVAHDQITLQAWENPQTLLRGGEWTDYSSMYTFSGSCPTYRGINDLGAATEGAQQWYPAPQTMINNIKILTDGTCGSACSQFVSRAYLTGAATLYTYGGFKDEDMDISAFNAGNVLGWSDVWSMYTLNSFAANAFVSPQKTPAAFWPPATGNFRYSYTAQRFPDILGPQSNWREMYVFPAAHHLQYWMPPQANAVKPGNSASAGWAELMHLYKQVNSLAPKPFSCAA